MSSPKIQNHVEDARNRLLAQYYGKPRIEGLLRGLTLEAQNVEDTLYDMYWKRSVFAAEGAQLDIIGNLVGQPREGWSDAVYRIHIFGKIAINTAQGSPENLIAMFIMMMQCNKAHYFPVFPAECYIMGDFAPIDTEELLEDHNMEDAGVGEWTSVNDAILTKDNVIFNGGLQSLKIEYDGTAEPGAAQDCLAIGQWYWLKGYFRTPVLGAQGGIIYNGVTPIGYLVPWLDFYKFDILFQATDQWLEFSTDLAVAGHVWYDSLSCRRLLVDNLADVYEACLKVVPVGVKLIGIGWYEGSGSWGDDDEDDDDPEDPNYNQYFSFEGDPDGLGFGDALDPTVGGKFASLFVW